MQQYPYTIQVAPASQPTPSFDPTNLIVPGLCIFGGLVLLLILWNLVFGPRWRVWKAHQEGLADLAQAKNDQQIQIAQAQSRLDAAELNKQAAVIEAEAVSLQIKAIGCELKEHDLYLRWQWIQMMEKRKKGTTVYVPTEANLPILEARRKQI